ncbi:MAG: hypothetical protein JSW11_04295 [Candidatus Heimdallarchaeota archaeon]|nr:MAG: hypothetical protein JSW11_04295 [Candidatus Heimdallarchaeota archaeon]
MSKDLYDQLGLTSEETRVYSIIISNLVRTIDEVVILARDLNPEVIKTALDGLEKKKFLRVIPGKVPQYIALAPAIAVTSEIDRQIENELNQSQEEIMNRWEVGQKELLDMINDFQKGPELFTRTEREIHSHINTYMEQIKTKSMEILQQIKKQISVQNQKNSKSLEELRSDFSSNLEAEVQKNISQLESQLQAIKDAQTEERAQLLEKISKIYSERIDSFNILFSQVKQSVQTHQQQLSNSTENLNSTLTSVNEQTKRNIKNSKATSQEDLDSIEEEVTKRVIDKLTIINQSIESVQSNLIEVSEESLKSIQGMVGIFREKTSQSSASVVEITNKTAENLWQHIQKMLQSFAQTISSLDEVKEKLTSQETINKLNVATSSVKDGLFKGLENLDEVYTGGVTLINTEMTKQLLSFQERMQNDISQLFTQLESSIQEKYAIGIEKITDLPLEISSLLDTNRNMIIQETSELHNKVLGDFKQQIQPTINNLSEYFTEMIRKISDSEKVFIEDSEIDLVDISTAIDELNLKMKETVSNRGKLSEALQYLRNVANEEFSSFGSSANMMLGQMQSTITENVAARTEEISQNFEVINQVTGELNKISNNSQAEISKILEQLETSIDAGNQTISEAFDQDIANLAMDVEEINKAAIKEQEDLIIASNDRLSSLSDRIGKSTLELSRNIPTQLEEYQARHTDDFNNFDRAVKAELNKIKARLTEINSEVTERLGKRVSLGKGGFQDIEKIVTSAMKDFESAQKRTERLIDDQIHNFNASSESFAETINTSLNTQNLEIQRLMDAISEDLSKSVNSSYELALKNISVFSNKIRERFNSRKDDLADHLSLLLSTISASLGESLKGSLVNEFEKMDSTLQQIKQTAQAPQELETILGAEVNNFIGNLQLAFRSASESGAARIAEVINESVTTEIERTYDILKEQFDLSNLKDIITSQLKSTSHKGTNVLSQISDELNEKSNVLLVSINENLQNLKTSLAETQNQINEFLGSQIQTLNSTQEEKFRKVPAHLEENKTDLISTLEGAQQKFQNSITTANQSINDSIKELSSMITSGTTEKLQDIRTLPNFLDKTTKELLDDIEFQYNSSQESIEDVRASSLDHLKNIEQLTAKQRIEFTDQIKNINIELEHELSELESMVAELDKNFPDIKTQTEKEIQQAIKSFSSDIRDISTKIETELSSGKIQLSQKMDRLYKEFLASVDSFASTGENFVNSLNTRHNTLLNQVNNFLDDSIANSINTMEIERKTVIDRQQAHFTEVDQSVTSFSANFGKVITNSLEGISNDIQESASGIISTITELGGAYYEPIDTMLTDSYSFFESEGQKIMNVLEHEVLNLVSETDKKATQTQDTISSDLAQLIGTIPDKIGAGLTKSKDLMSAISEVQKLAMEVPITSVEDTYLQTQTETKVIATLEAMLSRTKSTIQIMVPKLSMIPWDLLEQAGTRRRIQILTQVDSQEVANKISQELGNVQLKHYENVEVYAFARDGNEEAAIGSGDSSGIQLIITTDSRLIGILKEIIQDLWPRGKSI